MFNALVFLAVGALAGWLACKIMGLNGKSLVFDIILGVVGAAAGSLIGQLLGIYTAFLKLTVGSVLMAVVGACAVVFIYSWIVSRKK